ncbi:hypothetical protein J1N35_019230 [Gossypium stocksii]|uniref:Uncharacterized protein n=1 Tax=Gossypium stocksii TaxID=47602 RepID=A0A9D4A7F6_9ROSI|nr:hypothetical protein J1N35_019230 [Gossypium stocksii]
MRRSKYWGFPISALNAKINVAHSKVEVKESLIAEDLDNQASSSSDSGECSNLMLIKKNKKVITLIKNNKKNYRVGKVAFGDGKKGQILRKGTLNVLGMP